MSKYRQITHRPSNNPKRLALRDKTLGNIMVIRIISGALICSVITMITSLFWVCPPGSNGYCGMYLPIMIVFIVLISIPFGALSGLVFTFKKKPTDKVTAFTVANGWPYIAIAISFIAISIITPIDVKSAMRGL